MKEELLEGSSYYQHHTHSKAREQLHGSQNSDAGCGEHSKSEVTRFEMSRWEVLACVSASD